MSLTTNERRLKELTKSRWRWFRVMALAGGLFIGFLIAAGTAEAGGPRIKHDKKIDLYYFTQQAEVDALRGAACQTEDVFQMNAAFGYIGIFGSVAGLVAYNLTSMRNGYYHGELFPNFLLIGSVILTSYIAGQNQQAADANGVVCNSFWPIQGTKGER